MSNQPYAELEAPQRTPEGFLLSVSKMDRNIWIFLLIFGFIWTGISGFILFNVWQEPANFLKPFLLVFVSVFVLVGLFFCALGLSDLWVKSKLHPAELILPQYPLRLGESCSMHYRRRLRNGTFAKPAEIKARLICDEWVEYRQGTDTVSKTHDLWEMKLPTRTVVTGERQADYENEIAIPLEAFPSFYARHNKVRWRIIVNLTVPGIPQVCRSEFSLNVVPEMVVS